MSDIGWAILVQLALAKTTPLLLTAMGGLLSERSGVINIALEGMMLAGAFGSIAGSYLTGSPFAGLILGAASGALLAALHALCSVRYGADQIVSGTAINLMAVGGSGYLLYVLFDTHGSSPIVNKLPMLGYGSIVTHPTVFIAILASAGVAFLYHRSPWGLRLRAAGESPAALVSAGVSVSRVRYVAVVAGGVLAGVAGAHLALADLSQFVERMTAGRGFIALAALIFGKWKPSGVVLACLFFGVAETVADSLHGYGASLPPQLFLALPFVLTIVVLAGFVGSARAPAALGK